MSGTRRSANGTPGFAGDGELRIQIAGADCRARLRGAGSFALCAFPRAARRGRQGAQRGLSATTVRSGQPRSGRRGKRGAAPAGVVGGRAAGWGGQPAECRAGPGCRPCTAASESGFGAGGGASGGASSGDLAPLPLRMRAVARPELPAGKCLPPSRKRKATA